MALNARSGDTVERSRRDRFSRGFAICIVVGVHSLVVILIWSRDTVYVRTGPDTFAVWLRLDLPPRSSRAAIDTRSQQATAVTPRMPQPTVAPLETDAAATPQINWHAQAAFNAKRAVEDSVTERYRNLGPRKPSPKPEAEVPRLFEPEHNVFGEVAQDVLDDPIVRLTKHCYQELDKRIQTARDYGQPPRIHLVKCTYPAGKEEPRGDLFNHLKTNRPLPTPKDGVVSELPEKIEAAPSSEK